MANKCLIAYIDILGYKEMINTDEDKVKKIPVIISENIRFKRGREKYSDFPSISVRGMSDSIVFTLEIFGDTDIQKAVDHFLYLCSHIQYDLLKSEILCRGGVSFGDFEEITEENITYFYSKAYIKAVSLEKVVNYPIIAIEDELIISISHDLLQKHLVKDKFNNYFLNFLQFSDDDMLIKAKQYVNRNKLDSKISTNRNVLSKYQWLESYVNWTFSKCVNIFDYI